MEAERAFEKYHSQNFFLTQPSAGATDSAVTQHSNFNRSHASLMHTICSSERMPGTRLAGLQKVKESFLPFWVTTASVHVTLRGARLGYDAWEAVYNPATRRWEQQLRTNWRQIRLQQSWERSYSASEEGMQVHCATCPRNFSLHHYVLPRASRSPLPVTGMAKWRKHLF